VSQRSLQQCEVGESVVKMLLGPEDPIDQRCISTCSSTTTKNHRSPMN
jgi:hypothetical protein